VIQRWFCQGGKEKVSGKFSSLWGKMLNVGKSKNRRVYDMICFTYRLWLWELVLDQILI
jgi:hypothetical protein